MTNRFIRRTSSVAVLMLALVMLLSIAGSGMAQTSGAAQPGTPGGFHPLKGKKAVEELVEKTVKYADGRVSVIVTLADQPAVSAFINTGGRSAELNADMAADAQAAVVRQSQQ